MSLDPTQRFLDSMTINFDMWHDGTGYDLAALDLVPPGKLMEVEARLLARSPTDWRDIEALARIDTPTAQAAVKAALKHADPAVRREAMLHVPQAIDPVDREKRLLQSLESNDIYGGLSKAIDEAEAFHPPAVVDALFRGTLNRPGQTAVLFAALLYFIYGKADCAFDWDQRPFFLRFDTANADERKAVFREACQVLSVDPARYGA